MIMYSRWMALSLPIRQQIAEQFGIAKTGPTHVVDNQIKDDGYKIQDIENALSSDAMKDFLGVEKADHAALFDLLIAKFEKGVTPIADDAPIEIQEAAHVINTPKKRGRKPKTT